MRTHKTYLGDDNDPDDDDTTTTVPTKLKTTTTTTTAATCWFPLRSGSWAFRRLTTSCLIPRLRRKWHHENMAF